MDVPFPMIVTESESCVKLTRSKNWSREVKAISLLCPWNKINLRSYIIIESYLVCGVRQNASFMNGSSLDLSVIGILGIKTRRPLCVATATLHSNHPVHHSQYNQPCSIPKAEMLTNLEIPNKDNEPPFDFRL